MFYRKLQKHLLVKILDREFGIIKIFPSLTLNSKLEKKKKKKIPGEFKMNLKVSICFTAVKACYLFVNSECMIRDNTVIRLSFPT